MPCPFTPLLSLLPALFAYPLYRLRAGGEQRTQLLRAELERNGFQVLQEVASTTPCDAKPCATWGAPLRGVMERDGRRYELTFTALDATKRRWRLQERCILLPLREDTSTCDKRHHTEVVIMRRAMSNVECRQRGLTHDRSPELPGLHLYRARNEVSSTLMKPLASFLTRHASTERVECGRTEVLLSHRISFMPTQALTLIGSSCTRLDKLVEATDAVLSGAPPLPELYIANP